MVAQAHYCEASMVGPATNAGVALAFCGQILLIGIHHLSCFGEGAPRRRSRQRPSPLPARAPWTVLGTQLGSRKFFRIISNSFEFLIFIRAPSRAGGEARGSYEDMQFLGIPLKSIGIHRNSKQSLGIHRNSYEFI